MALGLYPEPEPPAIGLVGFIHESDDPDIFLYGGYDWTTAEFDAPVWDALTRAGLVAALPKPPPAEYNPRVVIPLLERLLPGVTGELEIFVRAFLDVARAAARNGSGLDIVFFPLPD